MEVLTMSAIEFHPYSKLFPMLDKDCLQSLADDIRQNGLRELITTDPDGRIIDGRNRFAACELAGVTPTYEAPFRGTDRDVLAFVISKNLKRRHLNESQRAMIAADIAELKPGKPAVNGKSANRPIYESAPVTQPEAAKMLNVSERSIRRARRVQKESPPETQQAVRDGRERLGAVERAAGPRPTKSKRAKAQSVRFNDDAFLPLCEQLQSWITQRFDKAGGAEARDECAKLVGQIQRRIEKWRSEKPI
jgi:ParB-like chromosome segregation protein Spo0J